MSVTKGLFLYCFNNETFPYHKLVPVCSYFAKMNLGIDICVASDESTLALIKKIPYINKIVDRFIEVDTPTHNGMRQYVRRSDSLRGVFKNKNKSSVYDLSPYDETIMIDLDYLIMDGSLNSVWGSSIPVRMNSNIAGIVAESPSSLHHMHPLGIPQYWSTVTYFNKSNISKLFFEGMEHIQNNYEYYARLYRYNHYMYRNDYSASIIAHAMNGGQGEYGLHDMVGSLPDPTLIFAWDDKPLLKIANDRLWFVGNVRGNKRTFTPSLVKKHSVHVLNKHSLLDIAVPWVTKQLENQYG